MTEKITKSELGVEDFEIHLHGLNYSSGTVRNYVRAVEIWQDEFKENCGKFRSGLLARGLSAGTINGQIAAVRKYLEFTDRHDEINKCSRIREGHREREVAEWEEYWKMVETEDVMIKKNLIETLLKTGLRLSEVLQLRESDFSKGEVLIIGKGNKERVVALPKLEGPCEFTTVLPRTAQRWVAEAGERIGLKVSPHQLRHAFATYALKKGMSLEVLQKTLGHSSLATTGMYLHPTGNEVKKQMADIF